MAAGQAGGRGHLVLDRWIGTGHITFAVPSLSKCMSVPGYAQRQRCGCAISAGRLPRRRRRQQLEYCYLDAVKLAGHSCPTVAGGYLATIRALRFL